MYFGRSGEHTGAQDHQFLTAETPDLEGRRDRDEPEEVPFDEDDACTQQLGSTTKSYMVVMENTSAAIRSGPLSDRSDEHEQNPMEQTN